MWLPTLMRRETRGLLARPPANCPFLLDYASNSSQVSSPGLRCVTPIVESTETLRKAQQESQAIGEAWVFPSPDNPAKPCARERMTKWMVSAKEKAGITAKGLGGTPCGVSSLQTTWKNR